VGYGLSAKGYGLHIMNYGLKVTDKVSLIIDYRL
jgi:hypothetical protein